MAALKKSKAPVNYCGFCDVALEKGEEINDKGRHFCSEPCRHVWLKTHETPTEKIIQNYKGLVDRLKRGVTDVRETCKENYHRFTTTLKSDGDNIDKKIDVIHVQLFGHIYNKNKEKSLKAFDRYKRYLQELLDDDIFGNEISSTLLDVKGEISKLSGEESLRVKALLFKLQIEKFELMIQQTFP